MKVRIARDQWKTPEETTHLEAIGVLVTRPATGIWVEEESLFLFIRNVVVQILGNGELSVELNGSSSAMRFDFQYN